MNNKNHIKGYLLAFFGYLIWGVLPIYWHNLNTVSSVEILLCRIVFSAITLIVYIYAAKNTLFISYLKDKTIRNKLILTSLLLAANWGFFLYTVNSNHVLQASLGYYINPLIIVLLGVIFLGEKLDKFKIAAIILAAIGVGYMTFSLGEFPYLSVIIAFSFGFYGYMKKRLHLDSYNSLLVEMTLLLPMALVYGVFLFITGKTTLTSVNSVQLILILLSGIVTCLPLIMFNEGAKRIPLSSLGFLQYLTPTLMLLIGVFLYNETFTKVHAVSFIFIWSGYLIYIISLFIPNKNSKN